MKRTRSLGTSHRTACPRRQALPCGMCWSKLSRKTAGAARRSLVLTALSAVGSPDGYKFYGVTRRVLQARFRSIRPAVISLLAALDSIFIMLAILALSVPLGIFFATSFGTFGAGVTLAVGAWLIALLFRWPRWKSMVCIYNKKFVNSLSNQNKARWCSWLSRQSNMVLAH